MIYPNQIKNTKFYESLNHVQRSVMMKKSNLKQIDLGVNMSKATNFEKWNTLYKPNTKIKGIVEELIK